jgi:hypothetical protein
MSSAKGNITDGTDEGNGCCMYPVHVTMNGITWIGQKKLGMVWPSIISAAVHFIL